ncbi:MAG: hypothetical protein ACRD2W_00675 [Acidimicrobiales bacterium]
MNRLLARSMAAALPLATALAAGAATAAAAHERRTAGSFAFVVGWGDEPAYTGFKNSVQVTVTEASGGAPVSNAGDTFAVEVIKGSDKTTLPLVGSATPGDYRAWLTPTRPGTYTLRLTGSVRGQLVDQTFTSGPNTFNEVEDVANSSFPAKDPSPGQIATRIDREVPRLDAAVREAEESASSARTLAFVGLAVGVLGLVAAGVALLALRRSTGGGKTAGRDRERAQSPSGEPESLSR